jgi:hypothetical protein
MLAVTGCSILLGARDRGDRGADLLSKDARLLLAGVGQQDEELLAAVAADDVAGTDRGP